MLTTSDRIIEARSETLSTIGLFVDEKIAFESGSTFECDEAGNVCCYHGGNYLARRGQIIIRELQERRLFPTQRLQNQSVNAALERLDKFQVSLASKPSIRCSNANGSTCFVTLVADQQDLIQSFRDEAARIQKRFPGWLCLLCCRDGSPAAADCVHASYKPKA